MTFEVSSEEFGSYETIEVINKKEDHHLIILPDRGSMPLKMKFFGLDIVEEIASPEMLHNDHWYRNFWLMPYAKPANMRNYLLR